MRDVETIKKLGKNVIAIAVMNYQEGFKQTDPLTQLLVAIGEIANHKDGENKFRKGEKESWKKCPIDPPQF